MLKPRVSARETRETRASGQGKVQAGRGPEARPSVAPDSRSGQQGKRRVHPQAKKAINRVALFPKKIQLRVPVLGIMHLRALPLVRTQ